MFARYCGCRHSVNADANVPADVDTAATDAVAVVDTVAADADASDTVAADHAAADDAADDDFADESKEECNADGFSAMCSSSEKEPPKDGISALRASSALALARLTSNGKSLGAHKSAAIVANSDLVTKHGAGVEEKHEEGVEESATIEAKSETGSEQVSYWDIDCPTRNGSPMPAHPASEGNALAPGLSLRLSVTRTTTL